jgi:hypothetical protein
LELIVLRLSAHAIASAPHAHRVPQCCGVLGKFWLSAVSMAEGWKPKRSRA